MENHFGKLLRRLREHAHKSMGELARHLDVSVVFVSDVEKGRRSPFTPARIADAAHFLGCDTRPLLIAAVQSKGSFQIDAATASPKQMEVGASLMRRWKDLSNDQLDQIEQIVDKKRAGGEE